MLRVTIQTLTVLSVLGNASVFADTNWQQWRGPNANGFAAKGNPPTRWDEKTNIKWKVELPGKGSSTPIIWNDRVFVLTAVDTNVKAAINDLPIVDSDFKRKTTTPKTYHSFQVLCFDRNSGNLLWKRTAAKLVPHEGIHPTHSYAAASPMTDGHRLIASFGSYGVFCYDLKGTLKWQRKLGKMYTRYGWGEATSPVLHGDSLIVNWDHEGQSELFVLDANTGKTRWKTKRDEPTSWATPLVVTRNGQAQIIVNGTNKVRSYDLASGNIIWQCGGQTLNAIPSPVAFREKLVVCMSGYGGSAAYAIPLDTKGDITGTNKVTWKIAKDTPYVPSPLLIGERLYFTQRNRPIMTCVNVVAGKTVIKSTRLSALTSLYASPVGVANRIYVVGREGTTMVLRQSDLGTLAINRLDERIDASPAIAGNQIFLRSHHHLYCIAAE